MSDDVPVSPPIHGFVPSDPPSSTNVPPTKRTGWPKGKPRGPRPKVGLVALPKDGEPACRLCGRAIAPLTLPVVEELLRIARDRINEGVSTETDVLYLAARADSYCGLTCWRKSHE